jgi:hypothetical protein
MEDERTTGIYFTATSVPGLHENKDNAGMYVGCMCKISLRCTCENCFYLISQSPDKDYTGTQ